MYNTPIIGIVAEYNPLHKGHKYHLDRTREAFPNCPIVVVLSSNFVQRGEPAFLDKWSRAEAALEAGADLILDLPTPFSCHQAQVFASAAVDILWATGLVTHMSFGMEDPSDLLEKAGSILIQEPPAFKLSLRKWLEQGFSFVEARTRALDEIETGLGTFLKGSNNLLALAYKIRIMSRGLPIKTFPIRRIGAAYNQKDFCDIPSATAIRTLWASGEKGRALEGLPDFCREILERESQKGRIVQREAPTWWNLLRWKILSSSTEEISLSAEMSEGLENNLKRWAARAQSYDEFLDRTVSRRYPRSRIQRLCCHLLLGYSHWFNRAAQRLGPSWIGVLGMSPIGKALLRRMRESAKLPVISRFTSPRDHYSRELLKMEERACQLWEILAGGDVSSFRSRRIITTCENQPGGSSPSSS
ncbi:MAG: nucleotidyltransferase family protein [Thermanaerothrix sp.]|nr:nucleotidyltransferase family protein [Thermanaerothrix sp.]